MRTFLTTLVAAALLTVPAAVQAQTKTPAPAAAVASTPAQRKAAEAFLNTMQVEKTLVSAMDQMITMQIQQRPEIKAVEPEMRAFMGKYMSWASLKEDMISLYAGEFSEKELKDLTKFYETPVGQKFVARQAFLMQAGMELGQRRVQENLPELQRAIEAKMKTESK